MVTLDQIAEALKSADAAGDTEAATTLAEAYRQASSSQPKDSGQGYVSSLASSAGRGFAGVVPGAIGGVGYLTGSEGLKSTANEIEQGIESYLPVNPIYEQSFPMKAANAGGQAISMLATGGIGGGIGKALGGVRAGAELSMLGSGFLQGARGGGQDAERYGMTGGTAYARALLGGAVEVATEKLLFGMGSETAMARRMLGESLEAGVGGAAKAIGTEGAEEFAAQVAGNSLNKTMSPEGTETPGILSGAGEATALGMVGGSVFAGVNSLAGVNRKAQTIESGVGEVFEDEIGEADIPGIGKVQYNATKISDPKLLAGMSAQDLKILTDSGLVKLPVAESPEIKASEPESVVDKEVAELTQNVEANAAVAPQTAEVLKEIVESPTETAPVVETQLQETYVPPEDIAQETILEGDGSVQDATSDAEGVAIPEELEVPNQDQPSNRDKVEQELKEDPTLHISSGPVDLFHGGLPHDATLDQVDLERAGSQQNKRNRSYGGFYLTDGSSRDWSEKYAKERGAAVHRIRLKTGSRVRYTQENIDRLNASQRAELAKKYDAVRGLDALGRSQWVLLNKDAVESFTPESKSDVTPQTEVEQPLPETTASQTPKTAQEVATPNDRVSFKQEGVMQQGKLVSVSNGVARIEMDDGSIRQAPVQRVSVAPEFQAALSDDIVQSLRARNESELSPEALSKWTPAVYDAAEQYARTGDISILDDLTSVQRKRVRDTYLDSLPELKEMLTRNEAKTERRIADAESKDEIRVRETTGKVDAVEHNDEDGTSWTTSPPPVKGVKPAAVLQVITDMRKILPGMPKVEVVSLADFEQSDRLKGGRDFFTAKGIPLEYVKAWVGHREGTVYIVTDSIANSAEARENLLHEIIGHMGVNAVATAPERARISRIIENVDPELGKMIEKTYSTKRGSQLYADELLAKFSERYQSADPANFKEMGKWQKAWDEIKRIVRAIIKRLGGDPNAFNDAALHKFYTAAVRAVAEGRIPMKSGYNTKQASLSNSQKVLADAAAVARGEKPPDESVGKIIEGLQNGGERKSLFGGKLKSGEAVGSMAERLKISSERVKAQRESQADEAEPEIQASLNPENPESRFSDFGERLQADERFTQEFQDAPATEFEVKHQQDTHDKAAAIIKADGLELAYVKFKDLDNSIPPEVRLAGLMQVAQQYDLLANAREAMGNLPGSEAYDSLMDRAIEAKVDVETRLNNAAREVNLANTWARMSPQGKLRRFERMLSGIRDKASKQEFGNDLGNVRKKVKRIVDESKKAAGEGGKLTDEQMEEAVQKAIADLNPKTRKARSAVPKIIRAILKSDGSGVFSDQSFSDAFSDAFDLPKLTSQDRSQISKLSREINKLPEGSLRDLKTNELLNKLALIKGVSATDAIMGMWYANVLAGLSTQAVNVWGNGALGFMNTLALMVGNGSVSDALAMIKGMAGPGGFRRGVEEAKNTLRTGSVHKNKMDEYNAQGALEVLKQQGRPKDIAEWLTWIGSLGYSTRYVFRAMAAADAIFWYMADEGYAHLAVNKAVRETGLTPGTPEFNAAVIERMGSLESMEASREQARAELKAAGQEAPEWLVNRRAWELRRGLRGDDVNKRSAFFADRQTLQQQPEGIGGTISKLITLLQSVQVGGVPVFRAMIPFNRVVANLFESGLDWAGVGILRGALGHHLTSGKEGRQFDNIERRQRFVAGMLGMTVAGLAYALAKKFEDDDDPPFAITAFGPRDPAKRAQWLAEGNRPFTMKVGNKRISYAETPMGMLLAGVGSWMDADKYQKLDKKSTADRFMYTALAGLSGFSSQGVLSSVNDLFEIMTGNANQKKLSGVPIRTLSGAIPAQGLLRDAASLFDDRKIDDNTLYAALFKDVPVLKSYGTRPSLNIFGEPVKIEGLPVVRRFVTGENVGPEAEFLGKHRLLIPALPAAIEIGQYLPKSYKESAKKNALQMLALENGMITPDQRYQFVKRSGELTKAAVNQLRKNAPKEMTKPQKVYYQKLLSKRVGDAREKAMLEIVRSFK